MKQKRKKPWYLLPVTLSSEDLAPTLIGGLWFLIIGIALVKSGLKFAAAENLIFILLIVLGVLLLILSLPLLMAVACSILTDRYRINENIQRSLEQYGEKPKDEGDD